MSTKYEFGSQVPTDVLAGRLAELATAVVARMNHEGEAFDREFTCRIPAENDRDADLVLSEASFRLMALSTQLTEAQEALDRLQGKYAALKSQLDTANQLKANAELLVEVQQRLAAAEQAEPVKYECQTMPLVDATIWSKWKECSKEIFDCVSVNPEYMGLKWRVRKLYTSPPPSAPVDEFTGWYCAHCRRGVDSSEVTFHEQHQVCGRVITNDRPPPPSAGVPDGWQLVPKEITPEMQRAYFDVIDKNMDRVQTDARFGRFANNALAYKAMLQSSPPAPKGERLDSERLHENLIFVGYTNGCQILYASDDKRGGEGSFYKTTDHDCFIPLYMLKTHQHRIQSTSKMMVTLDMIQEARKVQPPTEPAPKGESRGGKS